MIQLDRLPPDIVQSRRAVLWNSELRDGKPTKVPYQVSRPQQRADSTDPATWGTFGDAVAAFEDGKSAGVGITLGDGLCGVDLDDCIDPATGALESQAQAIVSSLNSYTEISPSGSGVKIFLRGSLPQGRRRTGNIEMYSDGRYFTVTGRHLEGTPNTIEDRTAELRALHERIFASTNKIKNGNGDHPPAVAVPLNLSDGELIERAKRATNGAKFAALFAGDTGAYDSPSEADLALCTLLAFWCGKDAGRMDRIFRSSGLMRDKWDTRRNDSTYGAVTIANAITSCHDTYSPRQLRAEPAPPSHDPYSDDPGSQEGNAELAWRTLADIDSTPPAGLLLNVLEPDGPNLMYAGGGVGKGSTFAWMTGELLKLGMQPLIYDPENRPKEWARRTDGLGIDRSKIVYVQPRDLPSTLMGQPLWDVVPHIGKIAKASGSDIVLVDSILAGMNIGEERLKSDAQAPYLYVAALDMLNLPSVSSGHTSRATPEGEPYGSVSWVNAMRLTWLGTPAEGEGHRVRWRPRKRNERGHIPAVLLHFHYQGNTLTDVARSDDELNTKAWIIAALRAGERTVEELAEDLAESFDEVTPQSLDRIKGRLRQTLARLKKEMVVKKATARRNAPWRLITPTNLSQ